MLAGDRPVLDRQVAQERLQLGGGEQGFTVSLYPGRTQKPQMRGTLHLYPVVRITKRLPRDTQDVAKGPMLDC
jgi:hypothetical protein